MAAAPRCSVGRKTAQSCYTLVLPAPVSLFQENFLPRRRWSSSLASLWRA